LARSAAVLVARKDLTLEARGLEQLALMVTLTFLIMLLFRVAYEGSPVPAGTALWVTLVFATTAGLARSFHAEADHGTLDLLSASPAPPASIYLGKVIASAVHGAAGALAATAVALMFFGTGFLRDPASLAAFLALGCLGLSALTSFFSALSARTPARGALFPVLVVPLAIPLMLWAARGTVAATAGASWGDPSIWLNLAFIAAYDALFLALFTFMAPRALAV
jgi:heme exporter protein B